VSGFLSKGCEQPLAAGEANDHREEQEISREAQNAYACPPCRSHGLDHSVGVMESRGGEASVVSAAIPAQPYIGQMPPGCRPFVGWLRDKRTCHPRIAALGQWAAPPGPHSPPAAVLSY
jgi:hypothetical protein